MIFLDVFLSATKILTIILFSILIPFFVFAVTLIGNAVLVSREKESREKELESHSVEEQIKEVEQELEALTKEKHSSAYSRLRSLRRRKKQSRFQIKQIEFKYSVLRIPESVIYIGICFFITLLLNEFAVANKEYFMVYLYSTILSLLFLGIGIAKLYRCLRLIQEVSMTSEDFQTRKLTNAFYDALTRHSRVSLGIKFSNRFPCFCRKNEALTLNFEVSIDEGHNVAKNAKIRFFIPAAFTILNQQSERLMLFSDPNNTLGARTNCIQIDMGDINVDTVTPGSIQLNSPDRSGKYSLAYWLSADGFSNPNKKLDIEILPG